MIFIIPPNFYVLNENATPPSQLEPFYNYGDFEICHLKRGDSLEQIPESDWYGISAYSEDYCMSLIIAQFLKSRDSGCKIAIGGSHATFRYSQIDKIFDAVIIGNGEFFVCNMSNPLSNNGRFWNVQERNTRWSECSFKHFSNYNPEHLRGAQNSSNIRFSFGCRFHCKFCANHNAVSYRMLADIEKQIQFLKDANITHIRIIDDCFTSHPQFKEIVLMLRSFRWSIVDRISSLTAEKCRFLKENNCYLVQVGIESMVESVRQKLGKQLSQKSIIMGMNNAKEAGIVVNAFLMLGTPFDTIETIKQSVDLAHDVFGDSLRPDIFCALPGSEIGDNPELYNLEVLTNDYKFYSVFPFQNTHGRLPMVPAHVRCYDEWEMLLRKTLYELSPPIIRNILDNPISEWYTDYV